MMEKIMILATLALGMLVISACSTNNPIYIVETTPKPITPSEPVESCHPQTEETSYHTSILTSPEGIVWLVPPIFDHGYISSCGQCGEFIDYMRRPLCPETGGRLSEGGGGHGGGWWSLGFVYDPELHLFGEPQVSGGYNRCHVGMHPFEEAIHWFPLDAWYGLSGFHIIQAVDSTKSNYRYWWIYRDGETFYERGNEWYLTEDAFLEEFAVMYDGMFVTDFIFDNGLCPGHIWYEWQYNAIAMSMEGRWGNIDRNGNAISPFVFEHIQYFDQSRARAVYSSKVGLIDRYGNTLIPFLFDDIYHFGTGFNYYRLVAVNNGRHGLINEIGDIVIPFLFEHLFDINGATAFAMYNGLYGIIDVYQTAENTR